MNCPRCSTAMQEVLAEGVLIDFCRSCKGTWLDKGEARFFSANPEAVDRALAADMIGAKPSPIACPRCKGKMTVGGVFEESYQLDRCNDCSGVWFDAKELSRLRDRTLLALDPSGARAGRPRGSLATTPANITADGGMPDLEPPHDAF